MKTEMRVANPDDVEFELTVSMSLKQWKELKDQLQDWHPSSGIKSKIVDMIIKANQRIYPTESE